MFDSKQVVRPLFIFGTRYTTLYSLTPSNYTNLPIKAIQLSFPHVYDNFTTFTSLPSDMSCKKFMGFNQNILTYLTPYDWSNSESILECSNTNIVKIKCRQEYVEVTPEKYDKIVETVKPNIYVGLCDYPFLQKQKSQSQIHHKMKKSNKKVQNYLEKKKNHENSLFLAPIFGNSSNLSQFQKILDKVLQFQINGLALCTDQNSQQIYQILSSRIKREKQQGRDLEVCLTGIGKPQQIKFAKSYGFTLFQVNYPFLLAQRYKALIWQNNRYSQKQPVKLPNNRPLEPNCRCYTCLNHSEAYLAHLIQNHEPTAKIFLTIHNISKYFS